MYTFIQKFHSGWAYLALLLVVITVVNSLAGINSKREFTGKDRKIALFGLIFAHMQLLVGLILYFVSQKGFKLFELGMGEVMKTAVYRQSAVEHPLTNIIAIALITVGWSKHKKATTSEAKFKTIAIFYGLGLILILSMIPWEAWLQL